MSFFSDGEVMLRHIINDVDSPQTYTDSRLDLALLVGAQFVNSSLNMRTNYTINFATVTINPDPTDSSTLDPWMLNLSVIYTSIIMLRNDLKLAGSSSWSIKDIDVSIDLRQSAIVKKQLLDDLLKLFEQAKLEYALGINVAGSAILTPFNALAGGSRGAYYYGDFRDRPYY